MEEPVLDIAKLSEKGQLVIPQGMRERLGLKRGSRLFLAMVDDAIVIQRAEVLGEKFRVREIVQRVKSLVSRIA